MEFTLGVITGSLFTLAINAIYSFRNVIRL